MIRIHSRPGRRHAKDEDYASAPADERSAKGIERRRKLIARVSAVLDELDERLNLEHVGRQQAHSTTAARKN